MNANKGNSADIWPKPPEAQAKSGDSQQDGRRRPWNGQVDQTNRAQQSSVRHFSATPTEIFPVVRRMPGYKLTQRRGTARIPPQVQRLVHSCAIRSCDYATLGSNPRKPSNQSMPSHIYVFNKEKHPASSSAVLNCDIILLA
jgi:hypothetical protein